MVLPVVSARTRVHTLMLLDANSIPCGGSEAPTPASSAPAAAGISLVSGSSRSGDDGGDSGAGREPDRTQGLYQGTTTGGLLRARRGRLRYLGGSTNVWGGWCRPLDASTSTIALLCPRAAGRSSGLCWILLRTAPMTLCGLGPYTYESDRCATAW